MSVEHYEALLAEVYDWMQGGWDHNVGLQRQLFRSLALAPGRAGAVAFDIGAGTGYQTIPLAELGYHVIAIEPSPSMLDQLRQHVDGRTVTLSTEPLARHTAIAELICCMGDTLAHFDSPDDVDAFFACAATRLEPGGRLLLTYRDSSVALVGADRFIPVRSDDDRIFTCFLESVGDRIRVHDIVHTRTDGGFEQRVSSYDKLRLHPERIDEALRRQGFVVRTSHVRGLVTTIATKADPRRTDGVVRA